jgi:hypothetical protein
VAESWIVRLPGTESAGLPADVGPARRDVTLGDDVTSVDTLLGGSDVDGEQHAVTLVVAAWADLVPRRWASRVLAGDESSYEAWLEEMFAAEAETVWNRPDLLLERLVARAGSAERVPAEVAVRAQGVCLKRLRIQPLHAWRERTRRGGRIWIR